MDNRLRWLPTFLMQSLPVARIHRRPSSLKDGVACSERGCAAVLQTMAQNLLGLSVSSFNQPTRPRDSTEFRRSAFLHTYVDSILMSLKLSSHHCFPANQRCNSQHLHTQKKQLKKLSAEFGLDDWFVNCVSKEIPETVRPEQVPTHIWK